MVTKLALQDIPTGDCRFMRLIDNSFYNPDIEVENAILEITPPGASCPVYFYTQKDFNTVFNSSTLDILPTNSYNGLVTLPDGVYRIKYSIQPNDILYQEFDHLRNCQQLQSYRQAFCELMTERCNISKREFKERLDHLDWIKQLSDSAKWQVEECNNVEYGLELYDEASYLLGKLC